MSYGTLSANPVNHYNKISYTLSGTARTIHVFKTDPRTEGIAPAVYEQVPRKS